MSESIKTFEEYITWLNKSKNDLLIFIVANDNIGRKLSQEHADLLITLGMKTNISSVALNGFVWRGYIAVIDEGCLKYETLAPNRKELEHIYKGFKLFSTFHQHSQYIRDAEVVKDDINYHTNMRGLTFVVFDKKQVFQNSYLLESYEDVPIFSDLTQKVIDKIKVYRTYKDVFGINFPDLKLMLPKHPYGETAIIFGVPQNKFKTFADEYNFNISSFSGGTVVSTSPVNWGGALYVFNGCVFSRNKNKERIFLKGDKEVAEKIIEVKDLCHELGDFQLLISEGNTIHLSTDYFGLSKWFYYHVDGIFTAATSFHMLVLVLKESGVKLEINTDVALNYFSRNIEYKCYLYTYDTFIKDVYYCSAVNDIKYIVSENRLVLENTPFYHDQVDVDEYNEELYLEYLHKAKDELVENMKAIYNHAEIDNVIVDITDGLDSRTNVAVISILPENLKQKTRLWTIRQENTPLNTGTNYVEDFKTACGIANLLDINFVDLPIDLTVSELRGENTLSNSDVSTSLGTMFIKRRVNWLNSMSYSNSVHLSGGNGESNNGTASYGTFTWELEDNFDIWYEKKTSLIDDNNIFVYGKTILKNVLDSFPSKYLQTKLDLLYTNFRNSFHNTQKYNSTFTFLSIQSICAYRAKKLMQTKQGFPFVSFHHDLLTEISPVVSNFPYFSKKQHKRFSISEKVRVTKNDFNRNVNYDTVRYDNCVPKRPTRYLPDKETYEKQLAIAKEKTGDANFYDDERKYFLLLKKVVEHIPELRQFSDKFVSLYMTSNTVRVNTTNLLMDLYYLIKIIGKQ